jgi:hypothetical protein
LEVLSLMHKKDQTLKKGNWHRCDRKILVIVLVDTDLDAIATGMKADRPEKDGFTEIWLADGKQIDIFGGMDIFAAVHPTLEGLFDVVSRDRKPYG